MDRVYILVARGGNGEFLVEVLDNDGVALGAARTVPATEFPGFVLHEEPRSPRWVWEDTASIYPVLLEAGVRVERAQDLRLCHAILRHSVLTAGSDLARAEPSRWDAALAVVAETRDPGATLFDLFGEESDVDAGGGFADAGAEFRLQLAAVAESEEPGRLRLLLAAESAGALIAAEMRFAGLPWRTDVHDELLTRVLGPRVGPGIRPALLEKLVARIRHELDDPLVNPDSPPELIRALRRAGLAVTSTRAWELKELDHPVIEPLLEYKKLARLLSANGWYWMDTWIVDGRFHPEYLPGGVVTGRWATRGGGALQLPKQVRGAVVADSGWKLVVADAAQLEPRILAALSGDTAMADAGRGSDLYAGIVASGVVETRAHAKVAMLGAMYGATTGESGRLLPRLARAYPRALALTETAARAGERGDQVTTRLGRSSPPPGDAWYAAQSLASSEGAGDADERRARTQARDWGRFTRNFVVQGSAAEWALCWMAEIRRELRKLSTEAQAPSGTGSGSGSGSRSGSASGSGSGSPSGSGGAVFADAPHLVFFLHDEVIVHTPEHLAARVVTIIEDAAATAGRHLFGTFPVDFLLTVATVDNYGDAK
ncbi:MULTISPECIES: bifunctional 3'-5' exonuclease/DNA polymerase [unclassified Cryobacterium]|uniref:bifunctional 3'-5' exonuclease/DNA polymerase n=1 Tax=unclassified Cryobacterium TaxID=2649013 RepID=UPI002AB50835|nr:MULTISPECIES: bifunctional 3'-5' exonuclease/DNA polymerase [unclassified Cryobacterium]MDY7543807.1 bifunctional 3'-5' exonuclease/DNA polymerase [Cryobacterium sp. 5B3]MEA9997613.1 bifunctional 3'-5' exonuclease/DNA polymerase [Cryobacterium sp. RTS3]MEB0267733.1 bifunctional 3'-5' exonuclease/DNA polymerase [Cryobacterium sp. 10I5]MEB0275186.1 bifunctional 3'-5' exonuclease/DNA polymerase [Cryobacterium sp. 5B3]